MNSLKRLGLLLVIALVAGVPAVARDKQKEKSPKEETASPVKQVAAGLTFRSIGPALMSGRISDIVVHPDNPHLWYVAAGSGGIWKTENAGVTFTPIFDDQPVYSIGCLAVDPSAPATLWVGTGENVSGRHVGFGDGVYRSRNGGTTWENMGLKDSEHIGRILVHPTDGNIVFVAAEGPLWSAGGERGLYRTVDGGESWKRVLHVSADTGITDVRMEPGNPDILYAGAYQRRRSVAAFMAGGPESGIYKSTDGGDSWRKLTVGVPGGHMGKIGLAVSPLKPEVVYATIEAGEKEKGFYRSEDRGESWEKRSSRIAGGTGPHYYQELVTDPHRFDRVYMMDVYMRVTDDGGRTFRPVGEDAKHVDNHALVIFPDGPDHLLAGCDGGLYESFDGGTTWRYFPHLPLTQFYKISVDNRSPVYFVHGGTQDNSSQMGPSRTLTRNGIRNADWFITTHADGYASAIDPEDPDIIYAEYQNGNLYRYDRRTGEMVYIKPAAGEGDEPLRFNWDSPVLISPHSSTRIYYGGNYLFRSENRGNSWERISPDLTKDRERLAMPMMGRTWSVDDLWDHRAMSEYGTITCISESPLMEGLLAVGTDDGLIQLSPDGGQTWTRATLPKWIPGDSFINDILLSRHAKDTVYAAVDAHKQGELKPYLLRSRDGGKRWQAITEGLPERSIVWSIVEDPKQKGLLFIGTEFGVYTSLDDGDNWMKLSAGLPTISFRDIVIQEEEDDLVCGSFGRGIYILDDYSPLRKLTEEKLSAEARIFPVKPVLQYIPASPLGGSGRASQGHAYFVAENPPYGAALTYWFNGELKTPEQKRREQEKEQLKSEENIDFPGWDALEAEARASDPALYLEIRDADGQVVDRIKVPHGKGLHRVSWDLRYPPINPVRAGEEESSDRRWKPRGPMVVPGTFSASLAKVESGTWAPVGEPQTFQVVSHRERTLAAADRHAVLGFQRQAGKLQRAVMGAYGLVGELNSRLDHLEAAFVQTPAADPLILEEIHGLKQRLMDIRKILYGDRTRAERSEAATPSILRLIRTQMNTLEPVTDTARSLLEQARARFDGVATNLNSMMEVDIPAIEAKLEAAGAPWTPGRPVPEVEE